MRVLMKFVFSISAILLPIALAAQSPSTPTPTRIWIRNVTIISPEKLGQMETGSVLIEGEHIARVERGAQTKPPDGSVIVSGEGKFLIPGLIDSHVHLDSVPGVRPEVSFGPQEGEPEMVRDYFRQLPRSYLYFGYTTLVDLGVINRRPLDEFRQAPLHPDVYDCGSPMPFANGYPMSFAPPELRFKLFPNFIFDPNQAASTPAEYSAKDHNPESLVAGVKNSGGICVKTYFERGFGTDRNLPVMSQHILSEIRKAAARSGLISVIHANSFEAQRFAVDGDVDVIAHGMWNWGSLDERTELPEEITKLLDRIVEKRIGYQPTIEVMEGLRVYFDSEYLKTSEIPKVIPKQMLEWFKSAEGQWFRKELAQGDVSNDTVRERYDDGPIRRVRQTVAYLANRDANFLFGTDTPSAPTYGNLPGLNGYLEMRQLQKAGLSLKQIFRAATINNAREFRLDSQLGTIEPGKIANLVLLEKSPLESIEAYDSVVTVWVHGKAVTRAYLAANVDE